MAREKKYIKTKRMREIFKAFRIDEVRNLKANGLWNSRKVELKICSECDIINCTCLRNQCGLGLIKLYTK